MLAIMKMNQLKKISARYNRLKNEAVRLMRSGDLHSYIIKLAEVEKAKNMYLATVRLSA